MWVCVNVSKREEGVMEAVCLTVVRGVELARRDRNINSSLVFVDLTVRMAADDVDVCVRGNVCQQG